VPARGLGKAVSLAAHASRLAEANGQAAEMKPAPLRRHCERSEAIQESRAAPGLPRRFAPRNDGSVAGIPSHLHRRDAVGESAVSTRARWPVQDRPARRPRSWWRTGGRR
jgi:hypothetical protein